MIGKIITLLSEHTHNFDKIYGMLDSYDANIKFCRKHKFPEQLAIFEARKKSINRVLKHYEELFNELKEIVHDENKF